MEDIPPSYDEINTSVLDLLPSYIDTATLVNLCLVSKSYYTIFISHLWGSPASHFVPVANQSSRTTNGINFADLRVSGTHNDMVYVALTRFKRTLRRARLSTRMLCHTLHLPAALSEIYGGPNSTWLREVLDWLPALQSLCVSGLPFFDHDSLVAVDQSRSAQASSDPNNEEFRCYSVKLLLAAKEPNVTWVGLSLLIPHLPHLVYLDLSYTSPARNVNVLRSLDALPHLQVLKLRGLGLRDSELEVLANTIKLRVRLLDIAENQLSDMAVRSLMQACVWLPSTQSINGHMPNEQYSRRHLESWPVGLPPPPDSLSLDTIRTVELDERLLMQLTNPLTGRLAFEDIPHGGITHLYISGNPGVTIESVRSMLDVGRLHVLDAGDIAALTPVDLQVLAAQHLSGADRDALRARGISTAGKNLKDLISRRKSRPSSLHSTESGVTDDFELEDDDFRLPGAEKLVPVLKEKASKNLTHLRVNHTVATATLDIAKELIAKNRSIKNLVELPGVESRAVEMDAVNREIFEAVGSNRHATEMTTETAIFEMDATPAMPRVELQGDMIYFAISPPVGDAPEQKLDEVLSPVRGEGAMAPEVVGADIEQDPVPTDTEINGGGSLSRSDTVVTQSTISSIQSSNSAKSTTVTGNVTCPAPLKIRKGGTHGSNGTNPPLSILQHAEIEKLLKSRPSMPITKLHPSFLPHLRTLILTNLPAQVPASSLLIDNLKQFVIACAAEARLANLRAKTDYSLPPGRARLDAEREHARKSFALRTIVLEIDPEADVHGQRRWKHTTKRFDISKSSTGDPDSEALWSAADNDFSFFGEEGEESTECGIYDQEPEKYYPTTVPFDEKIVVDNYSSSDRPGSRSGASSPASNAFGQRTTSKFLPITRNMTTMQSPRNLPLGRNRRISNDMHKTPASPGGPELGSIPRSPYGSASTELPVSVPQYRKQAPTSNPTPLAVIQPEQMIDVVAELAKWRRERKAAYEAEVLRRNRRPSSVTSSLADLEIFVDGYWSGEVKVIRNAKKNVPKGKLERKGNVDIFGNYFEGGYLYP